MEAFRQVYNHPAGRGKNMIFKEIQETQDISRTKLTPFANTKYNRVFF